MSTTERTRAAQKRLKPAERGALIAALATGMSQSQAAQQFGIHRNTVYNLVKDVKALNHPANPIAKDWKEAVLPTAQQAIDRGLVQAQDPIGAMNGALKLMFGLGYLSSDSRVHVDGNVALQVSWLPVQPPTEDAEILSISESDTSAETHDQ